MRTNPHSFQSIYSQLLKQSLLENGIIYAVKLCMKSVRIRSFLVHIFPHSDWIRGDTSYLSAFSQNAGEYGPEKLWIRTLFTQWRLCFCMCVVMRWKLPRWCLEASQTSKIECFAKIVNKWKLLAIFAKRFVVDVLDWALNMPLHRTN